MNFRELTILLAGLALAAGLAGCGNDNSSNYESSQNRGNSRTGTASSAGVVLTVAESDEYGQYIADQAGRALYLLEGEPQGQSTCYGRCAEVWPPLTVEEGAPRAGDPAVRADLIGTFQRGDGSMQVSYNGHALYYFVRDQGPGQVTGQDYTDQWGEWYLVTPAGQALED